MPSRRNYKKSRNLLHQEMLERNIRLLDEGFDYKLLSNYVDKMRGDRSYERFAFDAHMTTSTIHTLRAGKRKEPIFPSQLESMYECAEPDCGVTLSALYRANGMEPPAGINNEEVSVKDFPKEVLMPHSIKRTPKQKSENKAIVLHYQSLSKMPYENFKKNLGIYSFGLSKEEHYKLFDMKEKLYEDRWFVDVLDQYIEAHIKSYKNHEIQINDILYNNGLENFDHTAEYCKQAMDNVLGFTSRVGLQAFK